MRFPLLLLALVLPLAAHAADAPAAAASKPMTQQNRMGQCNADAGERKGDDRKAFMRECLSKKKESQQDKMKRCNAAATGKTGDERKQFMSQCLKGDGAGA